MKRKIRSLIFIILCLLAMVLLVLYVMRSIELSLNDIYSSP